MPEWPFHLTLITRLNPDLDGHFDTLWKLIEMALDGWVGRFVWESRLCKPLEDNLTWRNGGLRKAKSGMADLWWLLIARSRHLCLSHGLWVSVPLVTCIKGRRGMPGAVDPHRSHKSLPSGPRDDSHSLKCWNRSLLIGCNGRADNTVTVISGDLHVIMGWVVNEGIGIGDPGGSLRMIGWNIVQQWRVRNWVWVLLLLELSYEVSVWGDGHFVY